MQTQILKLQSKNHRDKLQYIQIYKNANALYTYMERNFIIQLSKEVYTNT